MAQDFSYHAIEFVEILYSAWVGARVRERYLTPGTW